MDKARLGHMIRLANTFTGMPGACALEYKYSTDPANFLFFSPTTHLGAAEYPRL
jgi:hypothetical protein